jgi:undecaprenyl-diphosphatase
VTLDLSTYEQLNGYAARHDWLEDLLRFFALDGQVVFVALLAALFLARGKYRSRNGRHGVVAAGLSAALALVVAQVIAHAWDRPRPYVAHPHDSHLLIGASPDPSFPSDHATAAFAIAVAIGLRHRTAGLVTLALALLVSVGRVAVGTHYPSDVVGGAILGTLAALVFWIPPIRGRLHRLADWMGRLYERLTPLPRAESSR